MTTCAAVAVLATETVCTLSSLVYTASCRIPRNTRSAFVNDSHDPGRDGARGGGVYLDGVAGVVGRHLAEAAGVRRPAFCRAGVAVVPRVEAQGRRRVGRRDAPRVHDVVQVALVHRHRRQRLVVHQGAQERRPHRLGRAQGHAAHRGDHRIGGVHGRRRRELDHRRVRLVLGGGHHRVVGHDHDRIIIVGHDHNVVVVSDHHDRVVLLGLRRGLRRGLRCTGRGGGRGKGWGRFGGGGRRGRGGLWRRSSCCRRRGCGGRLRGGRLRSGGGGRVVGGRGRSSSVARRLCDTKRKQVSFGSGSLN